jgi:hypothetical protein
MHSPPANPSPHPPCPTPTHQGAGEPVVYVALGSVVGPHAGLVHAMAAAFAATPARFVWSLKAASQAHLPPGAAGDGGRLHVTSWAPQAAVLAHPSVRCFVTHAGLGSLYEGLAAGRPLVALPFFADQHVNAQHVENRGLGTQVRCPCGCVFGGGALTPRCVEPARAPPARRCGGGLNSSPALGRAPAGRPRARGAGHAAAAPERRACGVA